MTTVLDICDEVAVLFESDAASRDDSRALPAEYAVDTLYVWPRTEVFAPDGDGSLDLESFVIRVAWVTDATAEQAALTRERATTDLVHAKAAQLAAAVRAHRTGATYEELRASVDFESLTTIEHRGFLMELTGYVLHA